MRQFSLIFLLLSLLSLAFCARHVEPQPAASPGVSTVEKKDNIPEKAREVLSHIRATGQPPRGYVGGRVWHNRERNLPLEGRYREYDINPKVKGKNRGPERLVIDEGAGKAWYTPDHYRTFILIK